MVYEMVNLHPIANQVLSVIMSNKSLKKALNEQHYNEHKLL